MLDIEKEIVLVLVWWNVGYVILVVVIEIVLWVVVGGDMELLMKSCVLEEGVWWKVEVLLVSLFKEM